MNKIMNVTRNKNVNIQRVGSKNESVSVLYGAFEIEMKNEFQVVVQLIKLLPNLLFGCIVSYQLLHVHVALPLPLSDFTSPLLPKPRGLLLDRLAVLS